MPPTADVKDTLISLWLSINHISFVPHDYFTALKKLRMLSLGWSWLTELPDVTDLASTLFELNLPHNNIVIYPNWILLVSMAQLDKLDLCDIHIEVFPPMILCGKPQLRSIGLAGNNRTPLAPYHDVTRSIKATINVDYNPLHSGVASLFDLYLHNNAIVNARSRILDAAGINGAIGIPGIIP